jgi:Toluene-4-monooxygenase system protein B (TmoB)
VLIHLFGHLQGDFVHRLMVIDSDQTVEVMANQLQAWGPELYPARISETTVRNESGARLEPSATLAQAGLRPGDIFAVEWVAP